VIRGQCFLFRFTVVQHELEASCSVRSGKREARARRITEDLGITGRIAGFVDVDDEPAFIEGRPLHADAETLPGHAAAAVTSDKIIAAQLALDVIPSHAQGYTSRRLCKFNELGAKPRGGALVASEVLAQSGFEHRLPEGVAARIAVFERLGLYRK